MHSDESPACERFDEAAWLLLSDELEVADRAAWERHLTGCDACAGLLAGRRRTLDLYDGLVPDPAPTIPMTAGTGSRPAVAAWRRPVLAIAAGLLLLAAGAFVMERRVRDLEVQLAVSRIDRPATAERLQGATAGGALVNRDPRILASLLDALEADPSPNVRLAAIDALYAARSTAPIEARFPALFAAQGSPILRIALIELAADRRLAGTVGELRRVATDSPDEAVRQRARWAIAALTQGV
jgi:hypothetical protein